MKKLFVNFDEKSLKLINNKCVIIRNYENVLHISVDEITLTKYIIKGDDLIVKKMDQFEIEIIGKIKEIKVI